MKMLEDMKKTIHSSEVAEDYSLAEIAAPVKTECTGEGQVGVTASDRLVDEAVQWINDKVEKTVFSSIIEIGSYILDKFFDNNVEKATSYNPGKDVSFRKLADHHELRLLRSQLNNAVGIAILRNNTDLPDLQVLGSSHLVALLPVRKNPLKLARLAEEATKQGWSYRRLVKEVRNSRLDRHISKAERIRKDLVIIHKKLERILHALHEDNFNETSRSSFNDELDRCAAILNMILH